jgi:hypothetical protein
MNSPEIRTSSNLTGDALGPNEPERDTSEVIIIGEDSRVEQLDTSYLSDDEKAELVALQTKIEARKAATAQLDARQADSLVEAVTLTADPQRQETFAQHFLLTLARQYGTVNHEDLRAHVEFVLSRAHKLGEGALNAASKQALEFKEAQLKRKEAELQALRMEAAEAKIETAFLAAASEHAFTEQLAYYMGNVEEMARIERLRDQVRQSTDSSIWEIFETQEELVLDSPRPARITTNELETMTQYVTSEEVSPVQGIAIERDKALEEALALARPSSEY